jgi:hypothetical protein
VADIQAHLDPGEGKQVVALLDGLDRGAGVLVENDLDAGGVGHLLGLFLVVEEAVPLLGRPLGLVARSASSICIRYLMPSFFIMSSWRTILGLTSSKDCSV